MRQERKRKRKRFWLIVFSLFLLLAAGGYTAYRYTLNLAAEKISKTLANDHELMEKIRKEAGGMEEIQSQELKQIAFSRFTPQEIAAVLKALQ